MALAIEVQRTDGTTLRLEPAPFDDFGFREGDQLDVVPPSEAQALPVTWGDRHVEISLGCWDPAPTPTTRPTRVAPWPTAKRPCAD